MELRKKIDSNHKKMLDLLVSIDKSFLEDINDEEKPKSPLKRTAKQFLPEIKGISF